MVLYKYLCRLIAILSLISLVGCSAMKQPTELKVQSFAELPVSKNDEVMIEIPTASVRAIEVSVPTPQPALTEIKTVKTTKRKRTVTTKRDSTVTEEITEVETTQTPIAQIILPTKIAEPTSQFITQVLTWLGMLSAMSIAWYTAISTRKNNTRADGQMLDS